jgi:hypothetical protein
MIRPRAGSPATGRDTIAEDRNHKDRLRAGEALLNRIGFHQMSEHKVTASHELSEREMLERVRRLEVELGVAPGRLVGANRIDGDGKLIEHEAVAEPDAGSGLDLVEAGVPSEES